MCKRMMMVGGGAAMLALGTGARAATIHDETVNGDLANAGGAPTALGTLALGASRVIAWSAGGDRDYFSITIGAGRQLSALNLVSYIGADQRAFLGVQSGATFTEPPTGTNVANLLGWTHFGPGTLAVAGSDILDNLGAGPGAQGFSGALGPGTYTFWAQQLGARTDYVLEFVVVPAPGMGAVMLGGLAVLARRRR